MLVAGVFGLVLGWILGRSLDDPRPATLALLIGMLVGAGLWIGGTGPDTELAGGSLLLGSTAGLIGLAPVLGRSS